MDELSRSSLWWNGPEWIMLTPIPDIYLNALVKESSLTVASHLTEINNSKNVKSFFEHVLSVLEDHSSFAKAVRILAYCLKWFKVNKLKREKRNRLWLSPDELYDARILHFKFIQAKYYHQELDSISKGKTIHQKK